MTVLQENQRGAETTGEIRIAADLPKARHKAQLI